MKILTLVLGLSLSGCAMFEQKIVMDTEAAAKIALAIGDQQAAVCWPVVGELFNVTIVGLASKYELIRATQVVAEGPCAGLLAGLTVHLLNKVPFTP